MEILICCFWEASCHSEIGVCHWISFGISIHLIFRSSYPSNFSYLTNWLVSTLTHFIGAIKSMWCCKPSVFFIIISFLFVSNYHWLCWKLRFLVLRVVFDRAVFSMQVSKVFVVFRVLVVMEWIKTLVCLNWHMVQPCWLFLLLSEILKLLEIIWGHVFNHAVVDFCGCLVSILRFGHKVQRLQICDLLWIECNLFPILVNNSKFILLSNGINNSRRIVNNFVLMPANTAVFSARYWPLRKCAPCTGVILQILFCELEAGQAFRLLDIAKYINELFLVCIIIFAFQTPQIFISARPILLEICLVVYQRIWFEAVRAQKRLVVVVSIQTFQVVGFQPRTSIFWVENQSCCTFRFWLAILVQIVSGAFCLSRLGANLTGGIVNLFQNIEFCLIPRQVFL